MVQAMLGASRVRLGAARYVLSLHRPARDLHRLGRIADVIDHQDVADVTLHLSRNIGVILVHIEPVYALAVSFDKAHELGIGPILDVINAEAAVGIVLEARTVAALELGIDDHEIADDPRLVRVRPRMVGR